MIRTWHISSNRWNSAITEYAISAVVATKRMGHQVCFSPLAGSPAERRAKTLGIAIEAFSEFSWRTIPKFLSIQRALTPDFIFLYGGPETFQAKFANQGKRIRFRGSDLDLSLRTRLFHHLSNRHVDAFVTPNFKIKAELNALGPQPVYPIMLGIDSERFRFTALDWESAQHQRPEILIVGRLDPIKGHAYLFEVFSLVLQGWDEAVKGPKPLLHVLGEPANISKLQLISAMAVCGLHDGRDVKLTIARAQNLAQLMTKAAVGIIPSIGSEAICRVAQEFLLCGTPVFLSGVGGLPEVLFPGAGINYRYGKSDVTMVAELLTSLLEQSVRETSEARSNRAYEASNRFSFQAMAKRFDEAGVFRNSAL